MKPICPKRRIDRAERGVTLVELLAVVAIMALFILVAVPSLGNYIRASRVRTSNDTIVSDLRAARYIAITNRTNNLLTTNVAGGSWTYSDIRGNTVNRKLEQGVSFVNSTGAVGSDTPVTYKSDGTTTAAATIYVQGNVLQGTAHRYTITISQVGKVSSTLARVAGP